MKKLPERWRAFLRAAASSAIATGVDVACLIAAVELLSIHVTLAAFAAALVGGVTNFLLNKLWAFRDPSPYWLRQALYYALVSVANAGWIAACVHLFAVIWGWPYLLAKAGAAVLVFVLWSYPAQARFVFAKNRPPAE